MAFLVPALVLGYRDTSPTRSVYGTAAVCPVHCSGTYTCTCLGKELMYLDETGWVEFADMEKNGTYGFLYGDKIGETCPSCYYAGMPWRWNYCRLTPVPPT